MSCYHGETIAPLVTFRRLRSLRSVITRYSKTGICNFLQSQNFFCAISDHSFVTDLHKRRDARGGCTAGVGTFHKRGQESQITIRAVRLLPDLS